ncbi:MAG: hypothetical protein HYR64_10335 [Fimbriimonas ginsengisoli]|uniref:Uncharacterized protein n=1 Tax=Fimbriimonas ginsengisoli TaxID=1005039 RepID=A0A931LU30_FIMGI|nr:hypothetical protein [Fimbriimonas ginsengisoli]
MAEQRIELAEAGNPAVLKRLKAHPGVAATCDRPGVTGVRFRRGSSWREVRVGDPRCELKGLVELMDNNPLVCADACSVPDAASTLALIALGPLASAGVLVEPPVILTNVPGDPALVNAFLATEAWARGATLHFEPIEAKGVADGTAIAIVRAPERLEELDELYEERFGRSFYVRRDETSPWDVALVAGKPYALYRLSVAPEADRCLVTIRAMADLDGKCGADQVIHAMNVMAGFEEDLGVGI